MAQASPAWGPQGFGVSGPLSKVSPSQCPGKHPGRACAAQGWPLVAALLHCSCPTGGEDSEDYQNSVSIHQWHKSMQAQGRCPETRWDGLPSCPGGCGCPRLHQVSPCQHCSLLGWPHHLNSLSRATSGKPQGQTDRQQSPCSDIPQGLQWSQALSWGVGWGTAAEGVCGQPHPPCSLVHRASPQSSTSVPSGEPG